MRVLVGITGAIGVLGVHAYLVRLAVEPDVTIALMMTTTAARIVDPGALGAVLRCPVTVDPWQKNQAVPASALTEEVDVLLVAPASATTIAYCATGTAANIVSACYLSHTRRCVFAPTMAPEMLNHPAVQRNLRTLATDNVVVLPNGQGLQISSGRWTGGGLCDYATLRDAVFNVTNSSAREVDRGVG
jgi:phosphopantothenoylcysteine decarboxylase/phosphopantothenate--cysteine ligase